MSAACFSPSSLNTTGSDLLCLLRLKDSISTSTLYTHLRCTRTRAHTNTNRLTFPSESIASWSMFPGGGVTHLLHTNETRAWPCVHAFAHQMHGRNDAFVFRLITQCCAFSFSFFFYKHINKDVIGWLVWRNGTTLVQ